MYTGKWSKKLSVLRQGINQSVYTWPNSPVHSATPPSRQSQYLSVAATHGHTGSVTLAVGLQMVAHLEHNCGTRVFTYIKGAVEQKTPAVMNQVEKSKADISNEKNNPRVQYCSPL